MGTAAELFATYGCFRCFGFANEREGGPVGAPPREHPSSSPPDPGVLWTRWFAGRGFCGWGLEVLVDAGIAVSVSGLLGSDESS